MNSPGAVEERLVPTDGIPKKVLAKVNGAHSGEIISNTYPYPSKLSRKQYEQEKAELQVELLKLQNWVAETGERVVLLFEGRDAAGKGGTIKRFMEHLNPRGASSRRPACPVREGARAVVLPALRAAPALERRAGVLRPLLVQQGGGRARDGFCSAAETLRFLRDTVMFEEMLINEGLHLFKFWFSVSREEQLRRVMSRAQDGLKQWKVSNVDLRSLPLWDKYTEAKKAMFAATDTKASPWVVVKSDDKKRARLACMRYVLRSLDYDPEARRRVAKPDPKLIGPAKSLYGKGEVW